jgi:hypothetical protein
MRKYQQHYWINHHPWTPFEDGSENLTVANPQLKMTPEWARVGRPVTECTEENVAKVREMIKDDHRVTILQIAEELGSNYG